MNTINYKKMSVKIIAMQTEIESTLDEFKNETRSFLLYYHGSTGNDEINPEFFLFKKITYLLIDDQNNIIIAFKNDEINFMKYICKYEPNIAVVISENVPDHWTKYMFGKLLKYEKFDAVLNLYRTCSRFNDFSVIINKIIVKLMIKQKTKTLFFLLENLKDEICTETMKSFCKRSANDIPLEMWYILKSYDIKLSPSLLEIYCENNNAEVVQWLLLSGLRPSFWCKKKSDRKSIVEIVNLLDLFK